MKQWFLALAVGFGSLTPAAMAASKIHVLILDGESAAPYHNWAAETPVLKQELEETGLFDVEVLTIQKDGDFSQFHPAWSKYQASGGTSYSTTA